MIHFQRAVKLWLSITLGDSNLKNRHERGMRLLEEALETAQSAGVTKAEARKLIAYTFGRPVGEMAQEVGGVAVTLAALADTFGVSLDSAAWGELDRVSTAKEKVRESQKRKARLGLGAPLES
jgi:hypothetical protein